MKPFLIIFISLFTLTAIGQQPEYPDSGFTNKAEAKNLTVNGLKEGKWVEYIGYVELGAPDNLLQVDVTGTNKPYTYYRLTIYKAGQPIGMVREYYKKSGLLKKETPYVNGKENGLEKCYYMDDGKLYSETPYTEGQINGDEKEYYMSGKVFRVTTYINGEKGVVKNYDKNGNEIKQ